MFFASLDRFLNQAMKMFDATEVVPINFVFFTASAIVAGMSAVKLSIFVGRVLLKAFCFLVKIRQVIFCIFDFQQIP